MGLYKRKGSETWWMSFSTGSRQYKKSTGTEDKKLAEKIFAKVTVQIQEDNWFEVNEAKRHTFDALMEKFMKEHATKQELNTQIRYRASRTHLTNYFTGLTLAEITAKDISAYIAKRRETLAAASTINKERSMLSKAFNLAVNRWEWCKQNPCDKVPRETENNNIIRWLSSEEEERLLHGASRYLNGQLQEIITVALNTGMRLGEILRIKWQEIDLFRKVVIVPITKNKEPKTIPLNQTALDMFKEKSKVVSMSGYVFVTGNGKKYRNRNVQREWYNAMKKAEITDFRFHDLRHTFATRLVQAGVDLYQVAKLLGHKDISTTQRYAHHCTESLRDSVNILDNFSDQKKAQIEAQNR